MIRPVLISFPTILLTRYNYQNSIMVNNSRNRNIFIVLMHCIRINYNISGKMNHIYWFVKYGEIFKKYKMMNVKNIFNEIVSALIVIILTNTLTCAALENGAGELSGR